jgi:flagellar biosynthesis regulator FlbT
MIGSNMFPSWELYALMLHSAAPDITKVVIERLLFNAKSAIFQLYHGENKLISNEMMVRSTEKTTDLAIFQPVCILNLLALII